MASISIKVVYLFSIKKGWVFDNLQGHLYGSWGRDGFFFSELFGSNWYSYSLATELTVAVIDLSQESWIAHIHQAVSIRETQFLSNQVKHKKLKVSFPTNH